MTIVKISEDGDHCGDGTIIYAMDEEIDHEWDKESDDGEGTLFCEMSQENIDRVKKGMDEWANVQQIMEDAWDVRRVSFHKENK